jgi:hypothetical protein
MENDTPLIFEVLTNRKIIQYWSYKIAVKPGTNLPKNQEEWADVLYNGRKGFEVMEPTHDKDYDSMMEEIITDVTIPLGKR